MAVAQVDKSGMVEGQFIVPALPKPYGMVGGKLITVLQPDGNDLFWLDVALSQDTFNSQLRLAHNHPSSGAGKMLGLAYTQAITPRLSLGGEGTVNVSTLSSSTAFCGRYDTPDWTGSATLKTGPQPGAPEPMSTLLAQYHRKVIPGRISLGTEIEMLLAQPTQSQVAFGAEFQLKQSKVATSIDGTGKICSLIEAKFEQHMTLSLSGELQFGGGPPDQQQQPTDHAKFGFAMTLG